jgi:glycosyltransferase involved in cell wall biosynthesis
MLADVDYVLSPSSFVTRSFTDRGFKPEQILKNVYPLDLSCFQPGPPREKNRPLTVISTGALSLRKGTPYLLEAFRLVHQRHPSARLRLTRVVQDNARDVLAKYQDLPIDWSPALPHPQLAARLQSSDIFVLPSLEDGFARTVTEALACGLPVITTPNTGASDLIVPGRNGEVVPIRDPKAIADAILKWADSILAGTQPPVTFDRDAVTFATFEKTFMNQLSALGLVPKNWDTVNHQ